MPDAYILGIESSCDETGASVVRSGEQTPPTSCFLGGHGDTTLERICSPERTTDAPVSSQELSIPRM